jgi:hypothetical protein
VRHEDRPSVRHEDRPSVRHEDRPSVRHEDRLSLDAVYDTQAHDKSQVAVAEGQSPWVFEKADRNGCADGGFVLYSSPPVLMLHRG